MGGLFNMDNPVMRFLGKMTDVLFLGIIYLVFSMPVITIGASTTALYYTTVKVIRRDRNYIFQSFWKSFKENFKDSTIIWLGILLMSGILSVNFRYTRHLGGTAGYVLFCVYMLMTFILVAVSAYIFPVLSRFVLPKKHILKNAFFMSVRHLPSTILFILIFAVSILAVMIMPVLILFMPAVTALVYSFPMERILKKYTESKGEEDQDEWYLE